MKKKRKKAKKAVRKTTKKTKKRPYLSNIKKAFEKTKFDKRFIFVFVFELIYYFSITSIFLGLGYKLFDRIKEIASGSMATSSETLISEIITSATPLLLKLIAIGVLSYTVLHILFKGTIWRKVVRQKARFSYYPKLILFNAIFLLLAAIVLTIGATSDAILFFAIIVFFLLIHFYYVALIKFTKENKLFYGIKQGFKRGWRVWLFALPYLIILLIAFAESVINQIVSRLTVPEINGISQTAINPSIVEIIDVFQGVVNAFPRLVPFLIISGIITVFFRTYIKIFYAEFVQTQ